jgi:general secretion pathway protein D
MRLCFFRSSLALVALAAVTPSLPAQAQAPAGPTTPALTPVVEDPIPIILPDAPLDAVLQLLEMLTGRIVLRPQNLPAATIHFESPTPLPPAQALMALETLLNMNHVGIAPLGDRFIKVVPLAQLRTETPEFIDGSTLKLPPTGRVATKVFTLNFLRANQIGPNIAPLLNPQLGGFTVFDNANAVMITDSISTLQRVEMLINQLDQPSMAGLEPKFYPLQHTKASDLVNKLRTMLQGTLQQQLGTATTFNADDRTNQVVLIADPRLHPFFDNMIARLDVRADPNTRNEVIPLKHANAPDVATIVSQLISGQTQAQQRAGAGTTGGRPGQMGPQGPQPPQPQPQAVVATADVNVASSEFSSFVTVLADERSNAIIVSGTLDDIRLIRELVEQIDVLLAQVRIEVVIVEVTLTDNHATGIQSLGLAVQNGKLVGIAGNLPGGTLTGLNPETGAATPFATFNMDRDLTGIITLASTPRKTSANILSVPAIVTTHNKEARIFVGQERPIISSYLSDVTGGTGGGTGMGNFGRTTVNQRQVGIELRVKPLIGVDGSVQLEIIQKVEDVLPQAVTIDGNEQPVIATRETESFVSVRNGEIIVLGGLQRENNNRTRSRLGPIPIIGDILGARNRTNEKTDLIFFLRPVVLTNTPDDNAEALRRIQGAPQQRAVERALNPDLQAEDPITPDTRTPLRRPGPRN